MWVLNLFTLKKIKHTRLFHLKTIQIICFKLIKPLTNIAPVDNILSISFNYILIELINLLSDSKVRCAY